MPIDKPDVTQASGFSFAPEYQPTDIVTPDDSKSKILSSMSSWANKFVERRDAEDSTAFLQGVLDETAGITKESGILTQKSYEDGAAYKRLSDSLSASTAKINDIRREEMESDNPNFESYNLRLQDEVKLLNDALQQSGLTSSALELAQKQMIAFASTSQADFQKDLKLRSDRLRADANATQSNLWSGSVFSSNGNTELIAFSTANLMGSLEQSYAQDTTNKDPKGSAAKDTVAAMKATLKNLNPAVPEHQQVIAGINQYIRSDEAVKILGSGYLDSTEAIVGKLEEVKGYNASALQTSLTEWERLITNGQVQPTRKDFQSKYADVLQKMQSGLITPEAAKTIYDKTWGIEKAFFKDTDESVAALSTDPAVRMSAFGSEYNSKQKDTWIQKIGSTFRSDAERAVAAITTGAQSTNPELVKFGGQQFSNVIQGMLLADPKKFDEVVTKDQKDSWRTTVNTYKSLMLQNPAYATAMLDGMPAEMRDAFEQVVNAADPAIGVNVAADITQLRSNMEQRAATKANGGFAGSFTRTPAANYTGENIRSDVIGRVQSWWSSESTSDQMTRAKNWYLEGNPEMQERTAYLLNRAKLLATPQLNAMEAKGVLIQTLGQQTRALAELGYIVPTETGPAILNPQLTTAAKNGYKAISGRPMSPELLGRSIDSIKDDYYKKFGGKIDSITNLSNFDIEDIVVDADGPIMKVYAYKNGSVVPAPIQKWGVSHVHEKAWQIEQSDRKREAPPVYVGEMVHGKTNLPISKELSSTFKGGLANDIVSSIFRFEGTTGLKKHQPDPKNRPEIVTIGPGIRIDGKFAQEPERAAIANAKTKQEYDAAMNKFMVKFYAGFPNLVQQAGLPPMEASNATGARTAHIALANAHWQAPSAAQEYAKLLVQARTDPKGAITALKSTALYKDINLASGGKAEANERMRLYREGLMSASRAAGMDNVWKRRGIDAFTKPSYPLSTTPEGWKGTKPLTPTEQQKLAARRKAVSDAVDAATTKPAYPLITTEEGWK